jgi:hypothetical protein
MNAKTRQQPTMNLSGEVTAQPKLPSFEPSKPAGPADYLGFDLSVHPGLPAIVEQLIAWSACCTRDGDTLSRCLVLAGAPGCGKTHLARLLVDHFRDPGAAIKFVNEPVFLAQLRGLYGRKESDEAIFRDLRQARLLIYDDLGGGNGKESWTDDCYYRLFEGLVEEGRAALITTNLGLAEFAVRVGRRAFSRLREAMGSPEMFVSMFDVPDYRARGW